MCFKKFLLIVCILILILSFPLFSLNGNNKNEIESWKLYSQALEELIDGNDSKAIALFEQVREQYPNTEASVKAQKILTQYSLKVDHSGIVPFYIGNILTSLLVIEGIPFLFEIDELIVYGSLGIAGVGTGIGAAWLLSKETDMSFARDIWIEFTQISAMANYQLLLKAADPYVDLGGTLKEKINLGGQMGIAVGTRALAYLATRDKKLSTGKASFVASGYAWANMYYWLAMNGIIKSENTTLNSVLGMIIPDLAAVGAYSAYDNLRFSANRVGFLSVGALGGGLLGGFANMIIYGILGEYPSRVVPSVLFGSIMVGQGAAYYFTRNMEQEKEINAMSGFKFGKNIVSIAPYGNKTGWGFSVAIHK